MKDYKIFVYDETKKQAVINKARELGYFVHSLTEDCFLKFLTNKYIFLFDKYGFEFSSDYRFFKENKHEEIILDDFLALEPETITLYHGTSLKNYDEILKKGLNSNSWLTTKRWHAWKIAERKAIQDSSSEVIISFEVFLNNDFKKQFSKVSGRKIQVYKNKIVLTEITKRIFIERGSLIVI